MLGSVLVVDDNAFVCQGLVRLFRSHPEFRVCGEAHNGQHAVEMAKSQAPDLIIMDIAMPVMNGIAASRELKKIMPDVPIIVFSESSDALSPEDANAAGISARVAEIARNIRRSIVQDKSLSTDAHNVKIISQNGMVTLKGPVKSDEEKNAIESKAADVVGKDKVTSQLEVKQ